MKKMGAGIFFFAVSVTFVMTVNPSFLGPDTYYMSMEHLNLTYVNPEYLYANATSKRPGRGEYQYYVYGSGRTLKTLDNTIKVDISFYEFRSNEYRRGFVEMSVHFCDMFNNNIFMQFTDQLPSCPLPPGEYRLAKIAIPDLPVLRSFPFRKGRMFILWTHLSDRVIEVYIDVEIKIRPRSQLTKTNKTIN